MKKLLSVPLALVAMTALIALVRMSRLRSAQLQVPSAAPLMLDAAGAAQRLGAALRIPTVSDPSRGGPDPSALADLRQHLDRSFPEVDRRLRREIIGDGSLLYTWEGRRPELEPVALLAHLDVVPAEGVWQTPPFEGRVQGGFVWGRGALDDKGAALAILEAVEALLRQGFRPERTVMLAFGHDEETGGSQGAAKIADLLAARGIRLASLLDEGEVIGQELVPGVAAPVAFIGVAEKGYLSVRLEAGGRAGHSSMPTHPGAVILLAQALVRLEGHPFPARGCDATDRMFETLAPEMGGVERFAFANRWLFDPLLRRELAASPATDALQRTTIAFTEVEGGTKENMLPARAAAVVNLRILPGEGVAGALEGLRARLRDTGVRVVPLLESAREPSDTTPSDDADYSKLARSVRQVFPSAVVVPALVLGGTDSAHYRGLTRRIYRFLPVPARAADLERFHGRDERIQVQDHLGAIRFYAQYLRNAAG